MKELYSFFFFFFISSTVNRKSKSEASLIYILWKASVSPSSPSPLEALRIFSLSLGFWNFTIICLDMRLLILYTEKLMNPFNLETWSLTFRKTSYLYSLMISCPCCSLLRGSFLSEVVTPRLIFYFYHSLIFYDSSSVFYHLGDSRAFIFYSSIELKVRQVVSYLRAHCWCWLFLFLL